MDIELLLKIFGTNREEIDIVAFKENEYIFLEVKTRTSKRFGNPVDAVDENKLKHIIKASRYFIYKYGLINANIRFDVIEVYIDKDNVQINHIKNILT